MGRFRRQGVEWCKHLSRCIPFSYYRYSCLYSEDNFNEETGKKIAYNKAANIEYAPRIYTTNRGVITKELVDTFLKQQVQFVKENPEKVIPGYLKAKVDYEALEAAKKEIDNLSDEERVAFNLAVNGGDLSKYMDLAKVYIKKLQK